jgi:hypothetical protein
VECEGAALVAVADGLQPDSKWRVLGGARIVDGVVHIKLRSLLPAE